ncbi:Fc receptor-like protein 5 [Microcebus murinus]|uniref:Fc receptor-like protein 5 n=1 Tax=Microcebus murinus TaxID=30608 RepID=UPI003F6BC880
MLLWVTLLVVAPVSGQWATTTRPIISLHPPWTTVFQGERVNLTCGGFHYLPQKTRWKCVYQRREILTNTPGDTLEVRESGQYRCQVGRSALSKPVHLHFSSASLILQAPLSVYEGDLVVLRCRAKARVTSYTIYKNREALTSLEGTSDFFIPDATLKDNGAYHCTGVTEDRLISSNEVKIQVQGKGFIILVHSCKDHRRHHNLFPSPMLRASPFQPLEGRSMTLTCVTQPPPQRSKVQLQFCFFRDSQALGSGWSSSPELQIRAMLPEDSGSYWCEAGTKTHSVLRKSQSFQIRVQRVLAKLQIHTVPASASVFEGQDLVLTCSADRALELITVSWYRRFKNKDEKIKTLMSSKFKISEVKSSDAGEYYCAANSRHSSFVSKPVTIEVKVPVSRPVLTLSSAGAPAFEGTIVTLHCEAERGSSRITYQFYREDVLLGSRVTPSGSGTSFSLSLTTEHSGNYSCTADNGLGPQRSEAVSLSVTVPASRPVLTLRTPPAGAVEGHVVELHCEALRGSPPIRYQFLHEDVSLGSSSATSGGGASFNLSLTAEHSGIYFCEADNGQGAQRSDTVSLSVTIPVSRPVLHLRAPRAQAAVGDVVELRCEATRGSPPISYQFYHEDATLGRSVAHTGGGVSFNLSLTAEHSGDYSCEADNGLGAQRSEVVTLKVIVPASSPVLTLRAPGAQAAVGDMVELCCEALEGSPPILYRFYHENITLWTSSALSGGGVSFNLSLTVEHSGNFSCEADNGLGAQRSEVLTLSFTWLTKNRRGPVATGVTGGLLSMMGLAAGVLLAYCWLSRKAGGKLASGPSRIPSDLNPQEPTYHNVPGWIELQPVYSNVNPRGGDVVYCELRSIPEKNRHAAASAPRLPSNKDSAVIYSQVKVASTPASRTQLSASSAPHR